VLTDEAAVITDLLARHRLLPAEVCYVADDIGDLPAMRLVGLSVAVSDAVGTWGGRAVVSVSQVASAYPDPRAPDRVRLISALFAERSVGSIEAVFRHVMERIRGVFKASRAALRG
jgi:hypothetical protein